MKALMMSVFLAIIVLLSGCEAIPEAVKGRSAVIEQNFISVHNTPQLYQDKEVRFGGLVASVINHPDNTQLVISSMPLDASARPLLSSASQGRFIAYVNRFLEPSDYKGRYVTVVGTVASTEKSKIGEMPYEFVVVKTTGIQRWTVTEQVMLPMVQPLWLGPDYPYWINRPYVSPGPLQIQRQLIE